MIEKKHKKLMLLGGLRYLLPVIRQAHHMGIHVITVDYIPTNIAHKYSDEYYNISILDKEKVLSIAHRLGIDGIMSFAVDPGVVTAAYVAEKLGLPSPGPLKSVEILQNKHLFRKFLRDNDFNCPWFKEFRNAEELSNYIDLIKFPVIVKPVDSAGSKGVTKVNNKYELPQAFNKALECSFSKEVIVEEFIEKKVCSSDSDCFSIDGKLEVITFNSQYFDSNSPNPYVPAAFSWPSEFKDEQINTLSIELQRLVNLLGMKTSIYNVETRIDKNGKPYIMEFSPRAGGNRLAEMIKYCYGVDLIKATIQGALGQQVESLSPKNLEGNWVEIILHAPETGRFESLQIDREFQKYIVETDLWVEKGDYVSSFNGANDSLGTIIANLPTNKAKENFMENYRSLIKISVSNR